MPLAVVESSCHQAEVENDAYVHHARPRSEVSAPDHALNPMASEGATTFPDSQETGAWHRRRFSGGPGRWKSTWR
eukprot:2964474-Alexandrium_andersonii.AAC.1